MYLWRSDAHLAQRAACRCFLGVQVVVQPYLQMVLKSLSAGTSKYIQSAAPLPIEWRYMMELSVHNSSPVDVKVSGGQILAVPFS